MKFNIHGCSTSHRWTVPLLSAPGYQARICCTYTHAESMLQLEEKGNSPLMISAQNARTGRDNGQPLSCYTSTAVEIISHTDPASLELRQRCALLAQVLMLLNGSWCTTS